MLAVRAAIETLSQKHIANIKAIVEDAIASAQHGLGLLGIFVAVESVGEGDTRSPVVVVGDMILRFPANAAGEGQILVGLPIVLKEQRGVKDVGQSR